MRGLKTKANQLGYHLDEPNQRRPFYDEYYWLTETISHKPRQIITRDKSHIRSYLYWIERANLDSHTNTILRGLLSRNLSLYFEARGLIFYKRDRSYSVTRHGETIISSNRIIDILFAMGMVESYCLWWQNRQNPKKKRQINFIPEEFFQRILAMGMVESCCLWWQNRQNSKKKRQINSIPEEFFQRTRK